MNRLPFIDGKRARAQTTTFMNKMILTKALFKVLLPNFSYTTPMENDNFVIVHSHTWTRLHQRHMCLSTSESHSQHSGLEPLL